MHVPFDRGPGWDEMKDFSRALWHAVVQRDPAHFTLNSRKDVRKRGIHLDYLCKRFGAGAMAPYSVCAKPAASVATPLRWDELARLRSVDSLSLQQTLRRLRGDPGAGLLKVSQKLPL